MWKRLNNPRGTRPPINNLATMDSFIDNPYGHSIHGPPQGSVNRKPSPQDNYLQADSTSKPRRDEDTMPKGLPRLPFEPVQPLQVHQNQQAHFRPASSVYSQPSPNPTTTQFARDQYGQDSYDEDVSPPSSPEYKVSRNQRQQYRTADQEVSPVDEMPDVTQLALNQSHLRPLENNIPVRRQRNPSDGTIPRKEVSERPNARNTVNPRWDPYSGEITTSDRGKPQSVKPKEFAGVTLRPTGLPLGNTSSITGGAKVHTSFSDRIRNLKTKNVVPAERPEWKGATGRVKLVAPVADRHDLPPLSVPKRNVVQIASPQSEAFSEPPTPETVVRSVETASASPIHEPVYEEEQERPSRLHTPVDDTTSAIISPPMIVKRFVHSPSPTVRSPVEDTSPRSPKPSYRRHDSSGTIERNFHQALKDVSVSDETSQPYIQPDSRFSITTYAPSETPRRSTDTWERPAMPSPPRSASSDNDSILNRKRPQIGQPMPTSISRKAINPGAPLFISMTSSVAQKRISSYSTLKGLPVTPAEAQSHDLVSSLQAQLDALQNRKKNIERGIRQMTELMPKDHIVLTDDVRRKREMEKRKVEALRSELADVGREEHEVGLKLHRAYKRRDKDAVYEPTALWVRRVT